MTRSALLSFATAVLAALTLPATLFAGPITIGPGPALGTDRAGVTWYQDFQDWLPADCRALDEAGTVDTKYLYGDGYDDSRDIVAFYEREEGGNLYFRVDLYDLALGAENGYLDVYVAMDAAAGGQSYLPDFLDCTTDRPWELCVNVYKAGTSYGSDYRIYDAELEQRHRTPTSARTSTASSTRSNSASPGRPC